MKFQEKCPPRKFNTGLNANICLYDCGEIYLDNDEIITFKTNSGTEYDFSKKDFGYYSSPSLNNRLTKFKLKSVLTKNSMSQYFILTVEEGKENLFYDYLTKEKMEVVFWLDDTEKLNSLYELIKKNEL